MDKKSYLDDINHNPSDYDDYVKLDGMPMREYYRGKSVFITGGTGFLGQLFVEKLLRAEVKELYVLTRPKKGVPSVERLQSTFSGPVFENLLKIDPNYMDRIKVIEGNLSELNIGITNADLTSIINNVQIILHSGAEVKFNELLYRLFLTNLRGTRELLQIAEKMKKLEVFIHISTAYSNCPRTKIEEKFYAPPLDPDMMIKFAELLGNDKEALEICTDKIIAPWPNTYTFTKAITEDLVRKFGERIPITIIRPSIVISTFQDPIPGWINNIYGLTGVLVATGLGFLRILTYKKKMIGDIVCADFVINSTLAAAWTSYEDQKKNVENFETNDMKYETKIFNIASGLDRPVTYGEIANRIKEVFYESPSEKVLWLPTGNVTENDTLKLFYTMLYHVLPALMFDLFFCLTGNEIRLMPMYRRTHNFITANTYFMTHQWIFQNDNIKSVYERMSSKDKKFFPGDLRIYNFKDFCFTYYTGMRKFLVKEDISDMSKSKAKKKLQKLQFAHGIVLIFYYSAFIYLYYQIFRFFGLFDFFANFFVTNTGEL